MRVGTLVVLRKKTLGNNPGTIGVVFYDYGDGFQVIFENGEYDGFSTERTINNGEIEADYFLKETGFDKSLADYKFKNVMQVSNDFRNGVFDSALVKENTKQCRCNNCSIVYDEDIVECPKCKTDKYLMQPFVPSKNDKKGE